MCPADSGSPAGGPEAPGGGQGSGVVARLVDAFAKRTLPHAEWTHEAHLRVGLWHVIHHGAGALTLLRQRIIRYNEAVGTANTDHSGYHETLTRFYTGLIGWFVAERGAARGIDDLADDLIREHGDRRLALTYYTEDRLMSVVARRGWLPPDRMSLPFPVPE